MGPSRSIVCCIAGMLSALGAVPASGQSYPVRPVEVIVTTSPGSGGDLVSRSVSEIVRREKLLPQPLVIVNRVGGAGVLGYTYFKTRRGDPYSMMSVTGTMLAMAYRPDVNIGLENYTPLALMAIDPQTIMVPADSPYKTVKELVEAARSAPGHAGLRRPPRSGYRAARAVPDGEGRAGREVQVRERSRAAAKRSPRPPAVIPLSRPRT